MMTSEFNSTVNVSSLNDDVFSDAVDENSYSQERSLVSEILGHFYIIEAIIKFLVWVLALASDIYLIVIISKFKNLRNRINHFILQYAIYHMLYLVLVYLILLVLQLINVRVYRPDSFCLIVNLNHLTLTLSFYVLLSMAVDWYVSNCHSNIYERFPKTFKYGVYITYLLSILKWITTSTICFVNHWQAAKVKLHLEVASFVFYAIVVIGITILKRKKVLCAEAYKTEYALTIPRIVLFWSLFLFFIRLIALFVPNEASSFMKVLFIIYDAAEDIFLAIPIVIVYQLAKLNKNFKTAYFKSCRRKRVGNYEDDDLDTDSVNETPGNNVTYNRSAEVINF